jgi:hypothetical protein
LSARHVDERCRPDAILLAREKRRNQDGPKERRRRLRIQTALLEMDSRDAYMIRRIYLDGVDVEQLAAAWRWDTKAMTRLAGRAVRRLREAVTT